MSLITAKNLSVALNGRTVLQNVDLSISSAEILTVIGPNGSGKTTLLRSFNRINERYGNVTTNGEISILGKNIYDADVSLPELRKSVGMVFQRPNPLPISIYDNIVFGLRAHTPRGELKRGMDLDEVVESALREVQLWEATKNKLKDKATSLTLEQQQKLCIARLLPLKPRIILMDEPCSALDADGIERVEELINELRERFTIVMVTHNMGQAKRASDECIYMYLGKIIEHSSTAELFLNPKEEQTAMYIEGRYG